MDLYSYQTSPLATIQQAIAPDPSAYMRPEDYAAMMANMQNYYGAQQSATNAPFGVPMPQDQMFMQQGVGAPMSMPTQSSFAPPPAPMPTLAPTLAASPIASPFAAQPWMNPAGNQTQRPTNIQQPAQSQAAPIQQRPTISSFAPQRTVSQVPGLTQAKQQQQTSAPQSSLQPGAWNNRSSMAPGSGFGGR